jgi:hypothetical protein
MLSYYKFNESYVRLGSENSFFEQVNNSSNEKLIVHSKILEFVQRLNEVKENWTEITEEEYNSVKTEVLNFLSAN